MKKLFGKLNEGQSCTDYIIGCRYYKGKYIQLTLSLFYYSLSIEYIKDCNDNGFKFKYWKNKILELKNSYESKKC